MTEGTVLRRIKRIQHHLGVKPDGLIGPATLTALEDALFGERSPGVSAGETHLTISRTGLKQLVHHEIGSEAFYRKFLSHPVWPGGRSGITIGIGYDLGHHTEEQIRSDWSEVLNGGDMTKLLAVAGLTGDAARRAVKNVQTVTIPLEAAKRVFYQSTLPRHARLTRRTYPGVEALHPDAQAALLSLVYNRGTRLSGRRRTEMAAIRELVAAGDYAGIAQQIRGMKRLWENTGADGLLKRRDQEAALVGRAARKTDAGDVMRV